MEYAHQLPSWSLPSGAASNASSSSTAAVALVLTALALTALAAAGLDAFTGTGGSCDASTANGARSAGLRAFHSSDKVCTWHAGTRSIQPLALQVDAQHAHSSEPWRCRQNRCQAARPPAAHGAPLQTRRTQTCCAFLRLRGARPWHRPLYKQTLPSQLVQECAGNARRTTGVLLALLGHGGQLAARRHAGRARVSLGCEQRLVGRRKRSPLGAQLLCGTQELRTAKRQQPAGRLLLQRAWRARLAQLAERQLRLFVLQNGAPLRTERHLHSQQPSDARARLQHASRGRRRTYADGARLTAGFSSSADTAASPFDADTAPPTAGTEAAAAIAAGAANGLRAGASCGACSAWRTRGCMRVSGCREGTAAARRCDARTLSGIAGLTAAAAAAAAAFVARSVGACSREAHSTQMRASEPIPAAADGLWSESTAAAHSHLNDRRLLAARARGCGVRRGNLCLQLKRAHGQGVQ
jgi:hypothetical protein